MSNSQKRQSWPLIEHISPRAAALLNHDFKPVEFNVRWLLEEDDQPSLQGKHGPPK